MLIVILIVIHQLQRRRCFRWVTGELEPGTSLPSVRTLASDLGINLHTVNKAYAVLRDEGYVIMRGRAGAVIAHPDDTHRQDKQKQTRRGIDASRPALSAWAYRSFARAQSILIVTIGTLLSFLGPLIELTLIGTIHIQNIVGPVLILIMIIMVASCAVSIVYGQNGSLL